MKNIKVPAIIIFLLILLSCDKYDLVRTNKNDRNSPDFKPSVPTLTTNSASSISATSAVLGGKITSDGGASVTAKGVVWSTTTNPLVTLATKTQDGSGTANYNSNLIGLTGSTLYYARAYATNSAGTGYGNTVSFTTLVAVTAPVLTTKTVTSVGLTKAMCGGDISASGGAEVTARGVCWGTALNPTIALATKTSDSLGTGSFNSTMTGLTAGTTYHVRAYATNSVGTSYGSDQSFTTLTVATTPTVTTTAASSVAMTTAMSGGNITFDGGADITARGICWSTTLNPTVALTTKTTNGTGTGAFSASISGLTAGTAYHVRAYATNSAGTAYGNDLLFTTTNVAVVATVTTTAVTNLTLNSLISGGNVIADGDAPVTTRGVCWATTINPTISNPRTFDGSGTGPFVSSVTGLSPNVTYHIRAYATNSAGTAYGQDIAVTTPATAVLATVTTTAASGMTSNSAASGGNITSDGGSFVTARGVCWSTTANPTIALTTKTTDATGTGTFTSNLTGLSGGTTYHIRAYATNSVGTAYGSDLTFTTLAAVIPTITTTAISENVGISVKTGGNIVSDGGASITAKGVCWGAALNPTTANAKTDEGTGSGSFVSSISGLAIGSAYHVRAYATNSAGTAYGQDIAFTTPNIPTLTTLDATVITPVSATAGGDITADGGAGVTERGIVWSTTINPTTALTTKLTSGSGSGAFYVNITGLNASTVYHIRAYAINSAGLAYGEDKTFTTSAAVVPTVSTASILSVTLNTATSGGNVTETGGAAVTARGVCWSTTTGPTVALPYKTVDASGTGTFISNLSGLSSNTTYYLRAYATNSAGTGYGPELIFRTAYGTLTDVEGNSYYTVQIGSQIWMRENLKTTKYRDNNFIINVTDNVSWSTSTTGAYSWYNNDAATNKNTYGAIYNWYTVTDSRGLCPTGWHVPTNANWDTLMTRTGGATVSGNKLKEAGTAHWLSNSGATNESGFTALPGGYRQTDGNFYSMGYYGYWWSSTEISTSAYFLELYYYSGNTYLSNINKATGYSIRCVKD